jgi:hypothetical protein
MPGQQQPVSGGQNGYQKLQRVAAGRRGWRRVQIRVHKYQEISWSAFTRPGEDGRLCMLCGLPVRTRSSTLLDAQRNLLHAVPSATLVIFGCPWFAGGGAPDVASEANGYLQRKAFYDAAKV